jgi:hypothetical protein
MILISLDIDLAAAVKREDLTSAVGHLFHHHPTYSDLHIARRITEEDDIELSTCQMKRIRLQNS